MKSANYPKACFVLIFIPVLCGLSVGPVLAEERSQAAKPDISVKSTNPEQPAEKQLKVAASNFAEVEIVLNERCSLADISGLKSAPGSDMEVIDGGKRMRVQLSSSDIKALVAKGVEVKVIREFVLVEGLPPTKAFEGRQYTASNIGADVTIQASCSGIYVQGVNNSNVIIPDESIGGSNDWVYSTIVISGAPAGAPVTCADVHYEIIHPWVGDLVVDLSDEYIDVYYSLWDDEYASGANLNETKTGITAFAGEYVNQEWKLWAIDMRPSNDNAYIDTWWIKLYYDESFPNYCSASGGCEEYISNVTIGAINNSSNCSGYAYYPAISTEVKIGQNYGITVTNGYPDTGDKCGIWVDWNQDEDFDDAGEAITVSGGPAIFTANITPPGGAVLGDTRMRVRITWNDAPAPCGATSYGEVEDYTVSVTSSVPQTLKVSGHVTLSNGTPLSGVLLEAYYGSFTPSGLTDISDENGYYEITLDSPWTGHIKADKDHYGFNWPTHFTDVTTDQTQNFSAYYTYSGGFGIAGQPYLIATAEDMNAIGAHPEDWDKYFKMIADVDMSEYTGTEYSVIGNVDNPFTGVFDGNNCSISNFTYNSAVGYHIGLFGFVDSINPATNKIKNLTLIDPNINVETGTALGALVGWMEEGQIWECGVKGGSVSGYQSVGALVGSNSGNISYCYAKTPVYGNGFLGGLIGYNSKSQITACYATGSVSGNFSVGGLTGHSEFCGITNCYSVGYVSDSLFTGGLIGSSNGNSVLASFWDTQTSNCSSSAGGTGKTTAEMQTESTFTGAGWDFATPIWKICEGTNYPKLAWQIPLSGDFVCPDGVEMNDLAVLVEQWLLEKLSADISPNGGDGFVDFADWAVFANAWQSTSAPPSANWNPKCDIAPAGGNGIVDMDDLTVFVNQWLQFGAYCADIAPEPDGDGKVNMLDFAEFAGQWLWEE